MFVLIHSGTVTTVDHHKIAFNHYPRDGDSAVIIAPGFYNCKDSVLLKELAEELHADQAVFIMDFRGHGASRGLFSFTTHEYLDLLAVIQQAAQTYKKIAVIGFSLGAASSLIAATKTHLIQSLILVSAPAQFSKIDYRFWQLSWEVDIQFNLFGRGKAGKGVRPGPFWLKKESPLECSPKLSIPQLFIHGENDWLIKPWHSQVLYEAARGKKELVVIPKGPHAEYLVLKNKSEFIKPIQNWLKDTLNKGGL